MHGVMRIDLFNLPKLYHAIQSGLLIDAKMGHATALPKFLVCLPKFPTLKEKP